MKNDINTSGTHPVRPFLMSGATAICLLFSFANVCMKRRIESEPKKESTESHADKKAKEEPQITKGTPIEPLPSSISTPKTSTLAAASSSSPTVTISTLAAASSGQATPERAKKTSMHRSDAHTFLHDIMDALNFAVPDALSKEKRAKKTPMPDTEKIASLQLATREGNPEALNLLFNTFPAEEKAVIARMPDKYGQTLLHYAISLGNPEILEILFSAFPKNERAEAAIKIRDKKSRGLFHYAAYLNNPEVLHALLELLSTEDRMATMDIKDKKGRTPLHYAVYSCNPKILQTLLNELPQNKRTAAIFLQDTCCMTPLHHAAQKDNSEVLQILLNTLPVEDRVAAMDMRDTWGATPLHHAAWKGNPEALKTLLNALPARDRMAAMNVRDKKGRMPLHYAAANTVLNLSNNRLSTSLTTVRILILLGADPEQKDSAGKTIYDIIKTSYLEIMIPQECRAEIIEFIKEALAERGAYWSHGKPTVEKPAAQAASSLSAEPVQPEPVQPELAQASRMPAASNATVVQNSAPLTASGRSIVVATSSTSSPSAISFLAAATTSLFTESIKR